MLPTAIHVALALALATTTWGAWGFILSYGLFLEVEAASKAFYFRVCDACNEKSRFCRDALRFSFRDIMLRTIVVACYRQNEDL